MHRRTLRTTSLLVLTLVAAGVGIGVTAADGNGATAGVDANGSKIIVNETVANTTGSGTNFTAAVATTPAQTNTLTVKQEYRLTPNHPGQIDVRWEFTIPDNVGEISTRLPSDATNPHRNGFEKTDDGYVWAASEQSTQTPTLTYTTEVNQTNRNISGPIGTDGRYLFVDAGDWALIESEPGPAFSLRYRGDRPTVKRANSTAGEGVVGQSMVYLGPSNTFAVRPLSNNGEQLLRDLLDASAALWNETNYQRFMRY